MRVVKIVACVFAATMFCFAILEAGERTPTPTARQSLANFAKGKKLKEKSIVITDESLSDYASQGELTLAEPGTKPTSGTKPEQKAEKQPTGKNTTNTEMFKHIWKRKATPPGSPEAIITDEIEPWVQGTRVDIVWLTVFCASQVWSDGASAYLPQSLHAQDGWTDTNYRDGWGMLISLYLVNDGKEIAVVSGGPDEEYSTEDDNIVGVFSIDPNANPRYGFNFPWRIRK